MVNNLLLKEKIYMLQNNFTASIFKENKKTMAPRTQLI